MGDNLRSNRDLKIAQKAMAKEMETAEIEHYIKGRHAFTKEQARTRKEFLNEVLRENKKRSKSLKEGELSEKWWRNDQRAKMRQSFEEEVMQEKKARIAAQREQRAASPRRALMSPRLAPGSPRYSPGRSSSPSSYKLEMQAKQREKELRLEASTSSPRGRSPRLSARGIASSLLSPGARSPTFRGGGSRTPTSGRSPTVPART